MKKVWNFITKHKLLTTVIFVFGIPLLINIAYSLGRKQALIITEWEAADVLSFYGAIVGAAGTIVLGIVAWQQNARLLKIEENTFLASNAGSALVTEVTIKGAKSVVCNLEQHTEQIVITEKVKTESNPLKYGSFTIQCKLEPIDKVQHVAFVKVNTVTITAATAEAKKVTIISAETTSEQYSRVAISKDFDRFELTVIMSKEEKNAFLIAVKNRNSIMEVNMELCLVTDKYVETELMCRAVFDNPSYDAEEDIYGHFKTSSENVPMCFWQGASCKNKQDIQIKTIAKGKQHGQTENALRQQG